MRKLPALIAACLAGVALTAAPAGAITGNAVPDDEHEYVGLALFYDDDGDFLARCSGSLLTDQVFLTAGHCTDGAASARVYFEQDAGLDYDPVTGRSASSGYPGSGGVTGSDVHDYGFSLPLEFPDTSDLGLVVLDAPVQEVYPDLDTYASLPAPGAVDAYGTGPDAAVTVSGYGYTWTNPVRTTSYRSRLTASTFVINLESHKAGGYNLQIASNPGDGRGGTCSGDSGGPVLRGDSDVVLAVNSFVLGRGLTCGGTGFAYRTDSAKIQEWILGVAGDEAGEIELGAP